MVAFMPHSMAPSAGLSKMVQSTVGSSLPVEADMTSIQPLHPFVPSAATSRSSSPGAQMEGDQSPVLYLEQVPLEDSLASLSPASTVVLTHTSAMPRSFRSASQLPVMPPVPAPRPGMFHAWSPSANVRVTRVRVRARKPSLSLGSLPPSPSSVVDVSSKVKAFTLHQAKGFAPAPVSPVPNAGSPGQRHILTGAAEPTLQHSASPYSYIRMGDKYYRTDAVPPSQPPATRSASAASPVATSLQTFPATLKAIRIRHSSPHSYAQYRARQPQPPPME